MTLDEKVMKMIPQGLRDAAAKSLRQCADILENVKNAEDIAEFVHLAVRTLGVISYFAGPGVKKLMKQQLDATYREARDEFAKDRAEASASAKSKDAAPPGGRFH